MAFFSDILQKLKKPVHALKDFLTPKEKKSMEFKVGEGLTPEQRVKAEAVLKKPAPNKLTYVPELGYAPYKSPTREMIAQLFGEGPRTSTIPEASKKVGSAILQFGKDVLRAGPRAAASVTLEAQGRRKMIPETKAERFLFGEEPLESITERIERFPERAKEFGISEPTSKKIAPFAIVGLTALDLIPGIPKKKIAETIAKEGSETVIKNLLKTKVFRNIADDAVESLARTLAPIKDAKKVQKALDDFVAASKAGKSAVRDLKAAATAKSAIPKELESYVPQAQKHKNISSFIKEIAGDTYAPEYRNPLADFWRKKYIQPLKKESKAIFTTDVVAFERNLDDVLESKYAKDQLANMSVRQKAEIVNGKKWTDKYAEMLDNHIFKFQEDFFKTAKATTPAPIKPTEALKEAAAQGVHSKKLETGIDEAYKALDKAGKDDVYTLGKVGDFITDNKVREQYKDVLDTPLYVKRQMHMGKAHGSLSVDPKGNPAIVLSDGLTADMIDRTLVEELTHAKQFKKGVRPTTGVPYKEIPEEIRAKKAAKHFAPKTTLEDLMEEAELHRAKAKQFSNNDLEREFVARQMGVAEGIEKAIDNIKSAKPTDELKKILYHGTDFENVPKIQKQGFKVGGFLVHGYPQGVYFTTTKREAQNYGKVLESTTNLKLSEFFDVSKHKELNKLSGDKYVQKLNQIIREAAESKGVAVPQATAKQTKQYVDLVGKKLKDPLDISDIKTATLQKLGYKGFIAAEKGIGKEIVIFDPKDIMVGGKPTEALKAVRNPNYKKVFDDAIKKGMSPTEAANYAVKNVGTSDIASELQPLAQKAAKAKNLDEFLKAEHPVFPAKKEFAYEHKEGISYITKDTKPHGTISVDSPILVPSEGIGKEVFDRAKVEQFKKRIANGEKFLPIGVRYSKDKHGYFLEVLDGHHRLTAAQEMGIKEVPFVFTNKVDLKEFYNHAVGEISKPIETLKAAAKTTTPIFEQGKSVTTPVVRQAQKGFESTDKFRGGTWYSTPESKNFDFTGTGPKAERGVGGPKKIEATLEIKKPFVIDDAIPEDGSFGVINSGYENVLPPKHRKLGNELYERVFGEHGLTSQELGVKEMKWANEDVLVDVGKKLGLTEARAKAVAQSSNGFDAMMDLVISDGLKQKGYDALILENRIKSGEVVDRHIFKFAEAEKVKPTAELKEILKGKPSAPARAQEVISEYQKRIDTTPTKKAATPISKTLDDTYTAIIDRFHPITKLARKASELRPGENPELLARRYLGVQGIAESKLFWNTTRLTAGGNLEVTGPGLSKILRPAKNNIDDLRTLMIAERDIELSKRTLESGKKVIGTTAQKSKEVINALKQKFGVQGYDQLSKTAQGVREWSRKALLDPLLEVGAISKEQYNTITKSNEFYVPFQRVIEELETHGFVPKKANIFTPKSVPVKKLKGSTKDIIDPFESLITNAYKVTDFVERARVGQSITNLRSVSPELADMIRPIKPKIVPVAKQGEELIYRPSFFTPEKNTMMVFENGKRKFYQVPEDVFKAVSGMMESDVGAIMKMLAFPARTLRAGATLTPEFIGRNPLRDQFTAFVFSKYGYVPGVDLARGVFNTIGKTDLHGRWLAGGGAQSMLVSLDRVTSQATLSKVLGAKDIKGLVKNPLEALRILSEFGEKGTRLGAFGKALKKGASDLEAAFESRDITLDFARRGSQTRAINMMVAFWNAQVQGLNKMVRAFRERPMQTTFKAASGITLPSVLLYLNNRNDPRYQELPQWQKDLFWIIPVGDKGPIIRIPKPFEVGIIFGTVPEHILSWIDKDDPEALTSAAKTLMEASAPGYIPTGLQPIIENVANYSFFRQRPIVSEGQQALPKEMQAGRYTSETAKELGKLIKQSPAKIENLFVGYTAGLGQYALDASDKLLKTLGVVSPPSAPAKTLSDYPFIRAFVAREPIGSGSASVDKFYKIYDEANATKAAVKGLAEEGKDQDAVTYLRSHPAGFYTKGLNKVARTFSDLRKKRDAVLDSRDLNPEQKKRAVDALDKIMTEIARQTVELVESSNEKFRQ